MNEWVSCLYHPQVLQIEPEEINFPSLGLSLGQTILSMVRSYSEASEACQIKEAGVVL